VGATGTFSGTFTAPPEAGDYNFRLRFPNVNEEVIVDGHRYHWRQSEASVVATVLPEYGIAALGALIACFAAFVVVKKRDSLLRHI
jgi:hypothetical protein